MSAFGQEVGEDEVIRELDVFVTNDQLRLYLAQFPLKPVYSDPVQVKSTKYKPNHHILELTVPYANNVQQNFDSNMENDTTQRYVSQEIVQNNCLATAFISQDVMYISPIDKVLQFRPSLKQSNGLTKLEAMEMTQDIDGYDDEEDDAPLSRGKASSSGAAENVQQVQLKRKESERAQSARLQSYSYLKQQEENEPWLAMKTHPIGKLAFHVPIFASSLIVFSYLLFIRF